MLLIAFFCAPVFCDFVRNYACTVDGAVITSFTQMTQRHTLGCLRPWIVFKIETAGPQYEQYHKDKFLSHFRGGRRLCNNLLTSTDIVIINLRFIQRQQNRSCGNQLFHWCLFKTKSKVYINISLALEKHLWMLLRPSSALAKYPASI